MKHFLPADLQSVTSCNSNPKYISYSRECSHKVDLSADSQDITELEHDLDLSKVWG